jgi:hypothetical protein
MPGKDEELPGISETFDLQAIFDWRWKADGPAKTNPARWTTGVVYVERTITCIGQPLLGATTKMIIQEVLPEMSPVATDLGQLRSGQSLAVGPNHLRMLQVPAIRGSRFSETWRICLCRRNARSGQLSLQHDAMAHVSDQFWTAILSVWVPLMPPTVNVSGAASPAATLGTVISNWYRPV